MATGEGIMNIRHWIKGWLLETIHARVHTHTHSKSIPCYIAGKTSSWRVYLLSIDPRTSVDQSTSLFTLHLLSDEQPGTGVPAPLLNLKASLPWSRGSKAAFRKARQLAQSSHKQICVALIYYVLGPTAAMCKQLTQNKNN